MIASDEITHWLTTVTAGEKYWDLVGAEDKADCGSIKAMNEIGFLARRTGRWDGDKEEWLRGEEEEMFYPWPAVVRVGVVEG